MFDNKKEAVDTRENEEFIINEKATTEIQRLAMHNALPICCCVADQSNLKPKRRKVIS